MEAPALPHLEEIFDELRRGYHICVDDGEFYFDLTNHFEEYRRLFDALGFELVRHDKDFFYFRTRRDLGKNATRMAVFFFVLVEALGDKGADLHDAIFEKDFRVDDLPHFDRPSHQQCLAEVDVEDQDELEDVVRELQRYGFVEKDHRIFRFREPAWRFVELCHDAAEVTESETSKQKAGGES